MTNITTPIKRHKWTKEELTHLNRTVAHSKKKGDAFQKIADEMGMSKQTVSGAFYNHHKATPKGIKVSAPKAKAASAPKAKTRSWSNPVQQGRPFSFTETSESELLELVQAISTEVDRRAKALMQIGELLK